MAISNYLYHNQEMTPERWIKTLKPCRIDRNFTEYMFKVGSQRDGTKILTSKQARALENLCNEIFPKKKFENFYVALRQLPVWDGLRLSLIVLLITKRTPAGSDILRMANNVIRLDEWQAKEPKKEKVINFIMDPDWKTANYGPSLDRMTNFLLSDIGVVEDINNNGKKAARAALQLEKEAFVTDLRDTLVDKLLGHFTAEPEHMTADKMSKEEQNELKKRLKADKLFGPILDAVQKIVHGAHGLTPHEIKQW